MASHKTTRFWNVDLNVMLKTALDPLVEGFGNKVDVLHVRWGRRYGARVELAGSGCRKPADPLVERLVALAGHFTAMRGSCGRAPNRESSTVEIEAASGSPPPAVEFGVGSAADMSMSP